MFPIVAFLCMIVPRSDSHRSRISPPTLGPHIVLNCFLSLYDPISRIENRHYRAWIRRLARAQRQEMCNDDRAILTAPNNSQPRNSIWNWSSLLLFFSLLYHSTTLLLPSRRGCCSSAMKPSNSLKQRHVNPHNKFCPGSMASIAHSRYRRLELPSGWIQDEAGMPCLSNMSDLLDLQDDLRVAGGVLVTPKVYT